MSKTTQLITDIQVSQIAKGISLLAVIMLHSLSSFFPIHTVTDNRLSFLYILLNQFARFCVPLFLALSGFGLSRKYQNQPLNIKEFVKRKINKLFPLYLLWSLILIFVFKLMDTWPSSGQPVWETILFGNADYHLYYVLLIFQMYLVFLVLPMIRNNRQFLLILIFSGLIQALNFYVIRRFSLKDLRLNEFILNDQTQYRLLGNWLFYFLLGAFLSRMNLDLIKTPKPIKIFLALMIGLGLAWSVFDSIWLFEKTGNIIYSTSFTRLPVMVYASGVICATLIFGSRLIYHLKLNSSLLLSIGKHSYAIYLSHTLFLRILENIVSGEGDLVSLALSATLLVGGLSVGKLFTIG
jgi:surface polysaccharide O-acyltransferase-like enzyme